MTFRDNNGRELLFDGDFAMTKQAVSLFNGAIKGDVSITFQVDNNSVNREILNYKGPQMTSQVAYVKQPFTRVSKGNVIDSGYIVIQSEDSDSLNCFYVSGNSNWMQLFQGLITELDYSGKTNGKNYNKTFNSTNVTASSSEGIVFPFADWCFNNKKGDDVYVTASRTEAWKDVENDTLKPLIQFYPCFYVHSLTNEIFNQSGIKRDGNLFEDPLYKSLALPPVDGLMKRDPFKKVLLSGSSQTYSAGGIYGKIAGLTVRQSDRSTWDDVLKRFTPPDDCAFYFSFTMKSGDAQLVKLYKNGVDVAGSGSPYSTVLGQKRRFGPFSAVAGDYFEVYATKLAGGSFTAAFDLEYEIPEIVLYDDVINPSNFLPSIKSIDIIKFLINFFGCSVYFDSTSNTITITVIEKIKLEDAYDWSEYYVSHKSEYVGNSASHNFINWSNSSDSEIEKYNQTHTLKYGDGDIQTDNNLLDQKQISKLPFAPSALKINFNDIYNLNIPLINLIDEGEGVSFTSIALEDAGPPIIARFTLSTDLLALNREVVRITNSDGVNIGYYRSTNTGSLFQDICFPFVSTDTGKIWRQKIEYLQIEPRIISVRPSTNISEISSSRSEISDISSSFFAPVSVDSFDYGIFTKSKTNLPIDQWKNNLAIDNPDSGNFTDPTIKELYFNKISRFIKNPEVNARMLLPDSVYQRFKFDQFIYLKTEKLTGYFFVDSIKNYVDSNTPVEVTLYML